MAMDAMPNKGLVWTGRVLSTVVVLPMLMGENVVLQTALPIIAWLGLYLREPRLKQLLPLRK